MTEVVPPGPGRRRGPDDAPSPNPWMEDHLVRLARLGPADAPVLDLGCGRGYWLRRMAKAGLSPVGIEYDPVRAAEAVRQAPAAAGDAARLPLRTASVGLVWSIHVLHHLPDPPVVLAEITRVLRPGGHLILAETVEDHPVIRLGRAVHPHWDGVGVHSRFRAAALLALVAGAGFEVVASRQHSLVSFAAWALPVGDRRAWSALLRVERRLPVGLSRWGAHLEVVARRP
ncbi:MAG TPA: class I SAM-dependent methyltransferase [Acidimicrobiales bacterium]